jgi:hypothetical protein
LIFSFCSHFLALARKCQELKKPPPLPNFSIVDRIFAFTMENPEKKNEQDVKARKAAVWSQLIEIGIDFALYIAIPLFAFIYAGKWLDAKYQHKFFVIIGIFLALGFSSYLIYKKIKSIKDLMDKK